MRSVAGTRVAGSLSRLRWALATLLPLVSLGGPPAAQTDTTDYPRLLAMQIGGPARYDDPRYQDAMARFDVLFLNFWPHWKEWKYGSRAIDKVLAAVTRQNPGILVGQYTNLNETKPFDDPDTVNQDLARKLDQSDWWLRDERKRMVRWTDRYRAFDINITEWTTPDNRGQRYPEWYADRNFQVFFVKHPALRFWYLDNSLSRPASREADWNNDGRLDDARAPIFAAAYRRGHLRYWNRIREIQPSAWLIGNSDDLSSPEYAGVLNGVFLEALIGKSWSIETRQGWSAMMARYHGSQDHLMAPRLVGFGVSGPPNDYQRLRYGLASCLLGDGYFSYDSSEADHDYEDIVWFDEFDVRLGHPLEPPALNAWQSGAFRRRFEGGMVIVNPTRLPARVTPEEGYRRIKGSQDPEVNNGQPAGHLVVPPKDGLILVRDFPARAEAETR